MQSLTLTCTRCALPKPTLSINGEAMCARCAHALIDAAAPTPPDERTLRRAGELAKAVSNGYSDLVEFERALGLPREALQAAAEVAVQQRWIKPQGGGAWYVLTRLGREHVAKLEASRKAAEEARKAAREAFENSPAFGFIRDVISPATASA